jgi:hypothetical protein
MCKILLRFVELKPISDTDCSGGVTTSLTTSDMASSRLYIMWGSYYDQLFLHGFVPIVALAFCYFK